MHTKYSKIKKKDRKCQIKHSKPRCQIDLFCI